MREVESRRFQLDRGQFPLRPSPAFHLPERLQNLLFGVILPRHLRSSWSSRGPRLGCPLGVDLTSDRQKSWRPRSGRGTQRFRWLPFCSDEIRDIVMTRAALTLLLLLLLTGIAPVVSASANETQTENANPGTTAWQLTNATITRQIEGYASLTSVNVGGSISFFVSTSDSSYTMDFYRIGWYGGAGGRELLGPITLPGGVQPTPSPDAYGDFECNWATSYVLTVPTNWVSGVYLVKLTGTTSGAQAYIQFVVREDSRNSVYLFQRSITTDQAYNDWPGKAAGGLSLYNGAVKVSFNRPYGIDESYNPLEYGAGFFLRWEINMVRWMEMNGYDVTYVTDIDVHENSNLLLSHKAFLSVDHDEYWSWQMRQNVDTALAAGVGLGFFSGNEIYWQIRLEPSTVNGAPDRTQVAYKSLSDPTINPCLMTILWRENTCMPSEQALSGVESTAWDVGASMVIADASNWALAGTGLVNGQVISGAVGYEADGMVQSNSPAGTQLIAHSPLPSGYPSDSDPYPAYPYSDMVTYTAASGATVFSVGTIQWGWLLDDWGSTPATGSARSSYLNAAAQKITANVLARLATDGATTAPGAPTNLLATAGNAQVGLSWSGSAGATSYNIERSTTNGGPYTTVGSPATTSYTDTGLSNGTTYYYVVAAVNSVGTSGNSNQASVLPEPSTTSGNNQDFNLAPNSQTTITVTPGQTALFILSVSPINGFNKTVSFSCSGVPAQLTCSLAPNSLALDGHTVAGLVVSIATPGSSLLFPNIFSILLTGLLLFASLMAAVCMRSHSFKGQLRTADRLLLIFLVSAIVILGGCGSGDKGNTGALTVGGAVRGSYALNVSGTSPSDSITLTHTVELNLVIQ